MHGCGSDTCLPGASNSLQTLTSVLSAAGDSLCFLSVAVAQLYHALYTYKWLFAQLIMGPLIALKWLQVTFLIQLSTSPKLVTQFVDVHFQICSHFRPVIPVNWLLKQSVSLIPCHAMVYNLPFKHYLFSVKIVVIFNQLWVTMSYIFTQSLWFTFYPLWWMEILEFQRARSSACLPLSVHKSTLRLISVQLTSAPHDHYVGPW